MSLFFNGNKDLIDKDVICLFSSRLLPLSIYYPALDFLGELMKKPITLAGGWHSPLEKNAIQKRTPKSISNIIFYLAKGMQNFTLPDTLQGDFRSGKVLIVSKWKDSRRIDMSKVNQRNRLILETFDRFLFLSIHNKGNLDRLFHKCLENGKTIYIFDHHTNEKWKQDGIVLVSTRNIREIV